MATRKQIAQHLAAQKAVKKGKKKETPAATHKTAADPNEQNPDATEDTEVDGQPESLEPVEPNE